MWNPFAHKEVSSLNFGLLIGEGKVVFSAATTTGQHQAIQCGSAELKNGTLPAIESALIALRNQYHLEHHHCHWILSPSDYQILLIDKPHVPEEEYRSAARWQIKELVSIPTDDLAIDVFLPSEKILSHRNKVYVVATKKSFLLPMVDMLAQINLPVRAISTPEFAIKNIIETVKGTTDNTAVLIQYKQSFYLTILYDNHIILSRRLNRDWENELLRSLEFVAATLSNAPIKNFFMNGLSLADQEKLTAFLANYDATLSPVLFEKYIQTTLGIKQEFLPDYVYAFGGMLISEDN